jgi:hypothetical protein
MHEPADIVFAVQGDSKQVDVNSVIGCIVVASLYEYREKVVT